MSEQYMWEPVEDGKYRVPGGTLIVYDGMVGMGTGIGKRNIYAGQLPADWAVCRRVPASAGVPVEVREAIAAVVHEIWAHWMHYLFSKCEQNPDGSVTIPVGLVLRWGRQINAPYNELSEQERESDRHQADKIMAAWLDAQPQTGQDAL